MVDTDKTEPAIEADDLSVDYLPKLASPRWEALAGVSFAVAPGQVLGVVGSAGSGKSTLARVVGELAGKDAADEMVISGGSLRVLGVQVRTASAKTLDRLRLRVAYLPQEAGNQLRAQFTVAENIAEPILQRDRRWDRQDLGIRVATLLDRMRLPLGLLEKLPYELSSGQRQRVALARTLILEPAVWVADEPTRGVDATSWSVVPELIAQERAARPEFCAVVVSHQLVLDSDVIDTVLQLDRGSRGLYASREEFLSDKGGFARTLRQLRPQNSR